MFKRFNQLIQILLFNSYFLAVPHQENYLKLLTNLVKVPPRGFEPRTTGCLRR